MTQKLPKTTARALFRTRLGLLGERAMRAFWPVWNLCLVVLACLMLGLQDILAIEVVWFIAVTAFLGIGAALFYGVRQFHWPRAHEARDRLDMTLAGRPLSTLADTQMIGAGDAASRAVWAAHRDRMQVRAAGARAVPGDLSVSRFDPFALRYVAVLGLAIALIFGSILRVGSVGDMAPGGSATAAVGPAWEGWVEPPRYTGRPTIYLPDIPAGDLKVPVGSQITLRLYGQVGSLIVAETVSGRIGELPPSSELTQTFDVSTSGGLRIDGPGGRTWQIALQPDRAPTVDFTAEFLLENERTNELRQAFEVRDDYGVESGLAKVSLNLGAVNRRYGLTIAPDVRDALELDLPMTIAGDRAAFAETLIEDLSQHPLANLPVSLTFEVRDALGQVGISPVKDMILPGRRFFDPLAKAIIEQRRDLMWARANATQVVQILKAVSYQPGDIFRQETDYLRLRVTLRRLERMAQFDLKPAQQDEIVQALWDMAIELEEGDLADAAERLRRAQEQLAEAIENGASDQEIAELMQELREAMQDYMRQLAEQSDPGEQGEQSAENTQEITGDELQEMLDRLQELMEQGRMAEAQELLEQLNQMMQNMQVTEGEQGQSEGQQAMEGLAETLRDQQGLSDDAFRDLQEQFDPDAQAGESAENEGRNGGQGQGESHDGEQGQGDGQEGGQEGQSGQQQGDGANDQREGLADRQQALRQELGRQRGSLPGGGTPEGDAAREALDRAGRAMDNAAEALRENDMAEAIDNQSEAMDALREGMQNLGEAMAQGQQDQQPGQGDEDQQTGNAAPQQRDPLGRDPSESGTIGSGEDLLQGDDVYRRAQDLLEELRRRSAETERPDVELDYLKRLLDRF